LCLVLSRLAQLLLLCSATIVLLRSSLATTVGFNNTAVEPPAVVPGKLCGESLSTGDVESWTVIRPLRALPTRRCTANRITLCSHILKKFFTWTRRCVLQSLTSYSRCVLQSLTSYTQGALYLSSLLLRVQRKTNQ
jgi:hypothetical protein